MSGSTDPTPRGMRGRRISPNPKLKTTATRGLKSCRDRIRYWENRTQFWGNITRSWTTRRATRSWETRRRAGKCRSTTMFDTSRVHRKSKQPPAIPKKGIPSWSHLRANPNIDIFSPSLFPTQSSKIYMTFTKLLINLIIPKLSPRCPNHTLPFLPLPFRRLNIFPLFLLDGRFLRYFHTLFL